MTDRAETDEAAARPGAEPRIEDRRTRLREALVDHAYQLLSTEGLGAMQARRVAQLAGCSVGAIYNVFPDLDELILRGNARTLLRMKDHERAALAALPADTPRAERMLALALAYVDYAFREETAWRSLFDYRLTYKKPYPDWYHAIQAEALGVLDEALPPPSSPAARETALRTARTIWAAVHGVVASGLDGRLGARSREEIEAQIRLLMSLIARGLSLDRT
ncbi:MAG: WHG domain-containing protein [Methylobacteriaceae bacterium]|nr:WHG domain-containing protein [Methylobacteriaceae bacterium]